MHRLRLMLFNSGLYAGFLLLVYVAYWLLRGQRLARTAMLVGASYLFYFVGTLETAKEQTPPLGPYAWSALCLAIIFVGSSLDFGIGLLLGRTESPRARKALLLVSIGYYLGVLALFKYWNFAADTVASVLSWLGVAIKPTHVRLVLPFGISFFTFETMSYTIDVYRRQIEPAKRYLDYLLFVCFFPHLVAGPIVRPQQLLPQLAQKLEGALATHEARMRGLFRIAVGLAKKMVLGDVLAVAVVAPVFGNPERYSSLEVLVAVYAYAVQIYADFSGYSDVALGSAALFGLELPENFDRPYAATSIQDFWRRWHMTLSSWLRDYLYVPLGGNRDGALRTYRNLMLTMLLGGLWHGASWNFVIWGGLHGGALAATRFVERRGLAMPRAFAPVAGFVTFHFVCFCWIFFRAPTFAHARLILERLLLLTGGAANLTPRVVGTVAAALVLFIAPRRMFSAASARFERLDPWAQGTALAAAAYAIHWASGVAPQPFVYGQF